MIKNLTKKEIIAISGGGWNFWDTPLGQAVEFVGTPIVNFIKWALTDPDLND